MLTERDSASACSGKLKVGVSSRFTASGPKISAIWSRATLKKTTHKSSVFLKVLVQNLYFPQDFSKTFEEVLGSEFQQYQPAVFDLMLTIFDTKEK